jgi:uncharacterized membrane protein YfhO
VAVRSTGHALLNVSRTYHRSWEAEVDGVSVPVIRANHALMAVPLARSGEHRVVMRYRPAIVRTATMTSVATWAAVLLISLLGGALHLRGARG